MINYIVLYLYLFSNSLLQTILNKRIKGLIFIAFIAIVFVLTIRGSHGVDTEIYLTFFNDIGKRVKGYDGLDLGFLYISK